MILAFPQTKADSVDCKSPTLLSRLVVGAVKFRETKCWKTQKNACVTTLRQRVGNLPQAVERLLGLLRLPSL
jgi:hypothetical protein